VGVVSIACYRPKRGKKRALEQLMREHVKTLRRESLATKRTPIIVRAKDGTVLEVFEWKSHKAIDKAHGNRAVLAMWERFGAACEYVKVSDVAESRDQWASFEPLDL
jgi:quinol monooxygenase YgiN